MALAPPKRACREAKSRRLSPARLASAINTMRGKERVQIEKPECPKLGGATGSLAHHIIKRQGTLPRGPKTRSDWLDKPDARLPLTDVISSISPSAIMITAIHTIFFIHHFSPLLILSCPLLIQKGFLSLTCCIGTNSNKAFFFCGYHIYRFTD